MCDRGDVGKAGANGLLDLQMEKSAANAPDVSIDRTRIR